MEPITTQKKENLKGQITENKNPPEPFDTDPGYFL